MIIAQAQVSDELYLTPARQLVAQKWEDPFESLFAEEYAKAQKRGKNEGEQIGYERAALELASLVSLLQRLSERLLEQRKSVLAQIKPEVITFALRVCEKVIRDELSNPDALVGLINALLEKAIHAFEGERIKIYLAPDERETLEKHLNKIYYDQSALANLSFHADPLLCRGDCRIEAKSGVLNSDIAQLLEDLKGKIEGCN